MIQFLVKININNGNNKKGGNNRMPKCVKCGIEIDIEQYQYYNNMCPECNRIHAITKKTAFSGIGALGAFLLLPGTITSVAGLFFINDRPGPIISLFGLAILIAAIVMIYYAKRQ